MQTDEKLLQRTATLIARGQLLFQHHPSDALKTQALPINLAAYTTWRTQSLSFMVDFLGDSHTYTREFIRAVQPAAGEVVLGVWVTAGLGVLHALRDDLINGYLTNYKTLVSAEVFTDLLEQADHLLEHNYKDPAASLCGAILEDGLRRIAALNGVNVQRRDGLSALNQGCATASIYNSLRQKNIAVWTDIRNNADHGHFNQYSTNDVREMLLGVRQFLADLLQ